MWQPIETAPAGEPFIAAIRVSWRGGDPYWEQHIICIDSDTGTITDCDFDHGYEWDDYSHWQPLPAPPENDT